MVEPTKSLSIHVDWWIRASTTDGIEKEIRKWSPMGFLDDLAPHQAIAGELGALAREQAVYAGILFAIAAALLHAIVLIRISLKHDARLLLLLVLLNLPTASAMARIKPGCAVSSAGPKPTWPKPIAASL
ncbi:MAG TPA: hypothetical protein VFE23_12265 [Usitatibacter sp.]|jgi:hypothetical protein|nr:hypothetical protein [Usitatibacter sp.]